VSSKINVHRLQEGLRARRFGRNIVFLREVGSTNDLAKELALFGAVEGTVVVAETQTVGRGRLSREWISPKGGLWFSVVLRPELKPAQAVGLVFVAGLAVAQVLRELYGLKAETRWPNDVLVNGRKVCGILTEMSTTGERVNYAVAGVGLNANFDAAKVFPQELRNTAVSLENVLGRKVRLQKLFIAMLEKLENSYELFMKEGFDPVLTEWKKYAGFLGRPVEVACGIEKWVGLASDVSSDGSLILRLEDGALKHFSVGDVTLQSR
jgi:BirA family biotin operon repressor/biotin-[acetyl-CoA-carboxylase] ligase